MCCHCFSNLCWNCVHIWHSRTHSYFWMAFKREKKMEKDAFLEPDVIVTTSSSRVWILDLATRQTWLLGITCTSMVCMWWVCVPLTFVDGGMEMGGLTSRRPSECQEPLTTEPVDNPPQRRKKKKKAQAIGRNTVQNHVLFTTTHLIPVEVGFY